MMAARFYRENPVFDEFTEFDSVKGVLRAVPRETFLAARGAGGAIFDGETFPTHTRFPRRVYFEITRRCNIECSYCMLRAGRGQAHVPAGAAIGMAEYLGRNGLMEVRLTGGEPTTHPGFFEILDAFRAAGVYVSVSTNGLMAPPVIDGLAARPNLWVICSVDGGRERHNHFRPGTYDHVVTNLQALKRKNPAIRLRLTTVLTRSNRGEFPALGALARSLGAESLTAIPLRPQVRAAAVLDEMLTGEEFGRAVGDLAEMGERYGIKVTTTIETSYASRISPDPVVRKRFSCAAGREATNLDYDARCGRFFLYGCSYSPAPDLGAPAALRELFTAGSFAADCPSGFGEIWRDEQRWRIYRDPSFKAEACAGCEYYRSNRCVGSCPIQNVDYSLLSGSPEVVSRVRAQLQAAGEWYCYRRIYGH